MKVSIIIPCYNEQEAIPYLKTKLDPALNILKNDYDIELVFVDDGSKDKTFYLLNKTFGKRKNVKIIQHKKNMNLGAAIRTGIQNSTGDIICAIDSDCSYDPMILIGMIKKLDKNIDIVNAAPLHPEGHVSKNLPAYRLFLTKFIIIFYNMITGKLKQRYTSYTGLVRVYKSEVIKSIKFKSNDFLAMSEIMIKSLFQGYNIDRKSVV